MIDYNLVANFIIRFEGFRSAPYLCSGGFLTIGYGHLISKNEDLDNVTISEAESILREDLLAVEAALSRLITRPCLNSYQYTALMSFTYNLGAGSFQRSRLRKSINAYEDTVASEEFMRWIWAGGRKIPGLVLRRAAERDMYLKYL